MIAVLFHKRYLNPPVKNESNDPAEQPPRTQVKFYIPIDYFCLKEKDHLWGLAEEQREAWRSRRECVLKKQKLPSMCFVNPGTIPVGAEEASELLLFDVRWLQRLVFKCRSLLTSTLNCTEVLESWLKVCKVRSSHTFIRGIVGLNYQVNHNLVLIFCKF